MADVISDAAGLDDSLVGMLGQQLSAQMTIMGTSRQSSSSVVSRIFLRTDN